MVQVGADFIRVPGRTARSAARNEGEWLAAFWPAHPANLTNWAEPPISTPQLPDFAQEERLRSLLEIAESLQHSLSRIEERLEVVEQAVQEVQELTLGLTQEYYWTEDWQERESRAEGDFAEGRFQGFDSAEDLITELNS